MGRRIFFSYGTQSDEAKALRNFKDKLEEMSEIWDQMLVRSIEVNQAFEKANTFGHLENGISVDEFKQRLAEKYGDDVQFSEKEIIGESGTNNWDYWTVYIQEKNKAVWEATLNIATSENGEKILYDISPIKMVEQAIKSATSTTKTIVPNSSPKINDKTVNIDDDMQHSEKMQDDLFDLFDESDRRKADKAEILEDLKRFEEYIKLEKKYAHSKHIDPRTLNMVTKWLCEKSDSKYPKAGLAKCIGDVYTYII